MSITLAIVLIILVISTWLYAMYLAWKFDQGVASGTIRTAPFLVRWERGIRLTRRGWYGAAMHAKQVLNWGNRKAGDAIVSVFPKTAPLFTKPDALTGLTDGPSSFFLKSISPSVKNPLKKKRLSTRKKMI